MLIGVFMSPIRALTASALCSRKFCLYHITKRREKKDYISSRCWDLDRRVGKKGEFWYGLCVYDWFQMVIFNVMWCDNDDADDDSPRILLRIFLQCSLILQYNTINGNHNELPPLSASGGRQPRIGRIREKTWNLKMQVKKKNRIIHLTVFKQSL